MGVISRARKWVVAWIALKRKVWYNRFISEAKRRTAGSVWAWVASSTMSVVLQPSPPLQNRFVAYEGGSAGFKGTVGPSKVAGRHLKRAVTVSEGCQKWCIRATQTYP